MRPGRSAGPRRRRGATREGDHPAWQGASAASNRKPGTPGSRAKPLPRSAGVRFRVRVDRGLRRPIGKGRGAEHGTPQDQQASARVLGRPMGMRAQVTRVSWAWSQCSRGECALRVVSRGRTDRSRATRGTPPLRRGVDAARPGPAVEWQKSAKRLLTCWPFTSCSTRWRRAPQGPVRRPNACQQWKKARGPKPRAGLPPPAGAEPRAAPPPPWSVTPSRKRPSRRRQPCGPRWRREAWEPRRASMSRR